VDFKAYLTSKKIDPDAFQSAEPGLWESLRAEFEQMSPASFTMQKLFLINPIRRKYRLPQAVAQNPPKSATTTPVAATTLSEEQTPPPVKKPGVARPVMKPKPKIQ
jgi:hypothetical protein